MSQADLARRLGISGAMVCKLHRRGMPLDEAGARAWRQKHLQAFRTKATRVDGNPGRTKPPLPTSATPLTVDQLVAMAELLAARLIDERDPWPEGLVHLRRMLDALPDEALSGLRLPERIEAMLYPDDDETAP